MRALSWWRGWGRIVVGATLSGGVVLWLARTLDGRQALLALRAVDYTWVGLGLLTVLCTLWARVRRWQVLLDASQVTPSATLQALVMGQLLNLILPARLGDLGRAEIITRNGYPSRAQALGTVALEKLWDILLLVGLVLGLAVWQPLPSWVTVPARLTAAGGGLLLAGILVALWLRRHVPPNSARFRPWPESARWNWLRRGLDRLGAGLAGAQRPQVMLVAGGWSALAWLCGALTNWTLLKAFDLPLSMGIALLLVVVLQLGVAVPSLPGRIGIFEGLCLVTLALFGIEADAALAYGVMLHFVVLLPPVALGLWWLLRLDAAARRTLWRLS